MTDVDFAIANELALLDQSENDNAKLNQNLQNTKNKEQSEKYAMFIQNMLNANKNKNLKFDQLKKANILLIDITNEITILIEKLKSLYIKKFPELPSIVTSAYDYVRTVQAIEHNDTSSTSLSFLPSNVYMALTFMFSSTKSNNLNENDKSAVNDLTSDIIELFEYKSQLLSLVANNMRKVAPNLTALLGADIASKLVAAAGGIDELAKLPSGNIMNIGVHYVNTEGFSSRNRINNGFLSELNEYKEANDKMKIKVLRRYANKTALAARADAFKYRKEDSDNESKSESESEKEEKNQKYGEEIKEAIKMKIDKIENDRMPILKKPLPRPDDKPRRKRGGKRTRSIRKRYELTEIRMLKNRMKFGPEGENEYRDTGEGMGMLKISGVGSRLRVNQVTNKINTKKQKIYDMKYANQTNNIYSGIHSSVVMTPMNGIELINPELLRNKLEETKDKYFNNNSGFSTVVKNRYEEI